MTKQTTEVFQGSDGANILLRKWLPEEAAIAAIVLAHGMTEHSERYDEFGQFLAQNGVALYCHDQRGHGETGVMSGTLGHLPPGIGWHLMVDDLAIIAKMIHKELDEPIFLMGHSMGSFIARCFVQQNSGFFAGLIISGTGAHQGKAAYLGEQLARLSGRIFGDRAENPLLQKLTFASFNQHFKPTRTTFDWLASDAQVVDDYIADPLCGFICTNGFYYELFDVNMTANDDKRNRKVDRAMPIYLFSGENDPVGGMGEGVRAIYQHYLACGIEDVTCTIYAGGRHEMLNECHKQDVYRDILGWIDKHL